MEKYVKGMVPIAGYLSELEERTPQILLTLRDGSPEASVRLSDQLAAGRQAAGEAAQKEWTGYEPPPRDLGEALDRTVPQLSKAWALRAGSRRPRPG